MSRPFDGKCLGVLFMGIIAKANALLGVVVGLTWCGFDCGAKNIYRQQHVKPLTYSIEKGPRVRPIRKPSRARGPAIIPMNKGDKQK